MQHFRIEPERVPVSRPPDAGVRSRRGSARSRCRVTRVERLGRRGRYLLYPAQFWAHKNHATLIEAVAELARDGREPYELVLVGSDKGQLDHVEGTGRERGDRRSSSTFSASSRPKTSSRSISTRMHSSYLSFFGPENLPPLEAFALGLPGRRGGRARRAENSSGTPPFRAADRRRCASPTPYGNSKSRRLGPSSSSEVGRAPLS